MNKYQDINDQVSAAELSSLSVFDLESLQDAIYPLLTVCPVKYLRRLSVCLTIVSLELRARATVKRRPVLGM